jgi:hypothetical protein
MSAAYNDLATAYATNSSAELQKVVAKHTDIFTRVCDCMVLMALWFNKGLGKISLGYQFGLSQTSGCFCEQEEHTETD